MGSYANICTRLPWYFGPFQFIVIITIHYHTYIKLPIMVTVVDVRCRGSGKTLRVCGRPSVTACVLQDQVHMFESRSLIYFLCCFPSFFLVVVLNYVRREKKMVRSPFYFYRVPVTVWWYADNTCMASRPADGLAKVATVVIHRCGAVDQILSEKKTEITATPARRSG